MDQSVQNLLRLDGRIVVVSGAGGGGIGTNIAELLARAGATVIGFGRTQASLDKNLGPLIAKGLPIVSLAADASTDEGIAKVMESAAKAKGELFGLVNVAGGAPPSSWCPATRMSRKDTRDLMAQNFESMFFLSAAVAGELKKKKKPGSLVSISSFSGVGAAPFHSAYGAAKAALVAATRTMALELGPSHIRVNCLAPGPTATEASKLYVGEDEKRDRRVIPLQRRGTPQEVASVVLFLLSDMGTYVTGQCLVLDGGMHLKWSHIGDDNTPVFLANEDFRQAMKRD